MKISNPFRRLVNLFSKDEPVNDSAQAAPVLSKVSADTRMAISSTAWRKEFRRIREDNAKWNLSNPIKRPRPTKRAEIEKEMRAMYRVDDRFGGDQVQTTKNLRKGYVRLIAERNRAHNREHPDAMWPTSPKKIRRAIGRHQREFGKTDARFPAAA